MIATLRKVFRIDLLACVVAGSRRGCHGLRHPHSGGHAANFFSTYEATSLWSPPETRERGTAAIRSAVLTRGPTVSRHRRDTTNAESA